MMTELKENFKEKLAAEKQPYLLEIYTPSCSICQRVMPLVEEVAIEHGDKYTFYKINAEAIPNVVEEYKITSVPTFLFIKDNKINKRHHGALTKEEMVTKLREVFE